jgi:hypothetical protein
MYHCSVYYKTITMLVGVLSSLTHPMPAAAAERRAAA